MNVTKPLAAVDEPCPVPLLPEIHELQAHLERLHDAINVIREYVGAVDRNVSETAARYGIEL